MTIELRAFEDAELLPLQEGPCLPLSTVTFEVQATTVSGAAGRAIAARKAFDAARKCFSASTMWLLSFHSSWQEDSLLARKVGFWSQRKLQGRYLPPFHRTELGLFSEGKCRFFGAGSFGFSDVNLVLEYLEEERQAVVVFSLGQEPSVAGFVSCGFGDERRMMPPLLGRLADYAARHESLLMRTFGEFDDREVGVDVIGSASVVKQLL